MAEIKPCPFCGCRVEVGQCFTALGEVEYSIEGFHGRD